MWFKHSMSIAQQLNPIYNTTVHKNKTNVALINCLCHKLNDTNRSLGRPRYSGSPRVLEVQNRFNLLQINSDEEMTLYDLDEAERGFF